jgi:hypothetical protein
MIFSIPTKQFKISGYLDFEMKIIIDERRAIRIEVGCPSSIFPMPHQPRPVKSSGCYPRFLT